MVLQHAEDVVRGAVHPHVVLLAVRYEWLDVMRAIAVTCGRVVDASSCLESGVLDCVTRK